jgi:hypothetical protein
MNHYLNALIWNLVGAAPWLIGISLSAGLLAWSPFGKLLARLLQDRRRDDDLLEANTAELAEVTRALALMTERLDATERALSRLAQRDAGAIALPRPLGEIAEEPRTPTPH